MVAEPSAPIWIIFLGFDPVVAFSPETLRIGMATRKIKHCSIRQQITGFIGIACQTKELNCFRDKLLVGSFYDL